jgi:glutamine synthetase
MSLYCPTHVDRAPPGLTFDRILGDVRCIPDKSTFRRAPWSKKQGMVFCKFYNDDGSPFKGCSRHLLETACDQLRKLGYEVKSGIEIEFVVLKSDTKEPYDNSTYYSLHSLAEAADDIDDLLEEFE